MVTRNGKTFPVMMWVGSNNMHKLTKKDGHHHMDGDKHMTDAEEKKARKTGHHDDKDHKDHKDHKEKKEHGGGSLFHDIHGVAEGLVNPLERIKHMITSMATQGTGL